VESTLVEALILNGLGERGFCKVVTREGEEILEALDGLAD
jgi:hypothetical protein